MKPRLRRKVMSSSGIILTDVEKRMKQSVKMQKNGQCKTILTRKILHVKAI